MKKGKKHRGSFDASEVAGDFSEIVARVNQINIPLVIFHD